MASKTFVKSPDDNTSNGSSESEERTVTESLQEENVYEGVEKKLILMYTGAGNVSIQKAIKEEVWNKVVEAVDAKVLSIVRGDHVDAYLLSESSLFVFKDRIFLKTCGTTRIFNAVEVIVTHLSEEMPGINLTRVAFSRPTYRFPNRQLRGYGKGFEEEVELLRSITMKATARSWESTIHSTGEGLMFHSSSLFPSGIQAKPMLIEGRAGHNECRKENISMDLAMFNLDQPKMKDFFGQQAIVLENLFVRGFLPTDSGLQVDEYHFDPCGYSLNAIVGEYYWSIHVTPEAQFSYISFETNHPSALDVYQKLQDFYLPERAIVLWADEEGTPTLLMD